MFWNERACCSASALAAEVATEQNWHLGRQAKQTCLGSHKVWGCCVTCHSAITTKMSVRCQEKYHTMVRLKAGVVWFSVKQLNWCLSDSRIACQSSRVLQVATLLHCWWSALRCNTESDHCSSAAQKRKAPFMVVKTGEQKLVNKHVIACHGILCSPLPLCLPIVGDHHPF